jgi:3-dehydroquinate synthase
MSVGSESENRGEASQVGAPPVIGLEQLGRGERGASIRIEVGGEARYEVVVGRGLAAELASCAAGAERLALIHSAPLRTRAVEIAAEARQAGFDAHLVQVPDGEAAKTAEVLQECWHRLGTLGLTRTDVVVGLGGGAVTDLAGFAAATWLRGVRVVQMPTSLLGMVDAALGGKTGINTALAKNQVGAFHAPAGVVCDLESLHSLPSRDLAAGLAEVVKAGFLADSTLLELIEADPDGAREVEGALLPELVARAVQVKAEIVTADYRESARRMVLNYGHTLAHALEQVEGYRWRHGEAVSVGLVYAAVVGQRLGLLDDETAVRHRRLLASLGLPVQYDPGAWPRLAEAMRLDKKNHGGHVRFVVLEGIGRPVVVDGLDPALLEAAYLEAMAPPETPPSERRGPEARHVDGPVDASWVPGGRARPTPPSTTREGAGS